MIAVAPVTLEGHGVRLEPLGYEHQSGLVAAAANGELWKLWFTSVPEPADTRAYIDAALEGQRAGHMLPWAVRELATNTVAGSTRYHDIVPAADRVEIGYTWYARALAEDARSTPPASCCCWRMRSTLSVAGSSDYAPTTSTSHRSVQSKRWAQRKTA